MILWIIGLSVGVVLLFLLFITFGPGFAVQPVPLERAASVFPHIKSQEPASRRDVGFEVDGTAISAWLYLPENTSAPVPCVVMAHGFGGVKNFLLEPYALRFTEAGLAVLTFDYRFFGDSGGEPRQLFSIPHQLEDVAAAVAFARSLVEVDPDKVALWGTSAGGGYGLTMAAKDHRIACVVSQVPSLDPDAAGKAFLKREGLGWLLRMVMHGLRDMLRGKLGLSAHRIPSIGKPGSIAVMNTPDAYGFFNKVVPDNLVNEVCARVFAPHSHRGDKVYRPLEDAKSVRCPVLLQIAGHDTLAPPIGGEKAAGILGELVVIKRYPIGHFDIYCEDHFERAVGDQLAFFRKHLFDAAGTE